MAIRALPEIGQRVKLAIRYGGAWRPLIWVRAGKDGSVYVGLLTGKPTVAKAAEKAAGKVTRIDYSDLKKLSEVPKSSRLSFKASGELHIGNTVVTGLVPLKDLKRPLHLCNVFFAHPGRYKPLSRKHKDDYDIRIEEYKVDDERPTYATVFVAPLDTKTNLLVRLSSMTHFVFRTIPFRGFTKTPDLLVGIVLGHGPKRAWPDLPTAAVPSR